jgi:hypothetical protein
MDYRILSNGRFPDATDEVGDFNRSGCLSPVFLIIFSPSATPFVASSVFFGWHITVPIYFALQIWQSRSRAFYFPQPRAIDVAVAKGLPFVLVLAYATPLVQSTHVAHFSLPILAFLGGQVLKRLTTVPAGIETLYGDLDIPYQMLLQSIMFLAGAGVHLFLLYQHRLGFLAPLTPQHWSIALTIIFWSCLTLFDLARVQVIGARLFPALFGVVIGSV